MKKRIILLILFTLGALFLLSAQEERLFREAERRFLKGDYQFAYSRYSQLIEEYPDSPYVADAGFRQAVILSYLGKNEEALQQFVRVSERYSHTRFYSFIPFWKGYTLFQLGRYEEALESLRISIEEGSESLLRDSLFYKALVEKKLGRREEAFTTVKDLYLLYEDPVQNPEMLLLYTSLLVETGRYEQLYDLYSGLRFDALDPKFRIKLSLYRGEALFMQGRDEEATPLYLELLSQKDDVQATAYKRLYVLYGRNGETEKQQEVFDEAQSALADRPELMAEFLLRAGIQSYKEGDYDLSRSYLRRIRRTIPAKKIDGLVPLYLSHILEREGNMESAVSLLREFLQGSDSRREELLMALGRLETGLQRWSSAADVMVEFLGEFSDSEWIPEANYLYSYALYREGKNRQALSVVAESFSTGESGKFDRELLRLRSRLHILLDLPGAAMEDLREYLPRYPEDIEARVDLVKLYFESEKYDELQKIVRQLREGLEKIPESDEAIQVYKLFYIEGVSFLKERDYRAALESFSSLDLGRLEGAGLEELVPHFLFYNGWSEYKQNNYGAADGWFDSLLEQYPDSPRAVEARYLRGWAAYASEDFLKAQQAFGRYSRMDIAEEQKIRGLFMYAKSSAALGKDDDALIVYQAIYRDFSESGLADDALYEYAVLLQAGDRVDEAIETYYRLYRQYPTSPLSEEALYRRGELYYREGEYQKARDAFYEHRVRFPEGELVDLSLYWSGKAALGAEQAYGAVLVWEKLIEKHRDSEFLDETILELAGLYAKLGEHQKAVSYYTSYVSAYPDRSHEGEIQQQVDTLKRIIAGQSAQEAELSVKLERLGLQIREGRETALELVRLYLYQYPEKKENAHELLEELIALEDKDRGIAARAYYLMGEYHQKGGNPRSAADSYVRAAVVGSGDDDLVAGALFRAAQSAVDAGDTGTARRMVQKLRADFPHTQWVIEGESLLKSISGRTGEGE